MQRVTVATSIILVLFAFITLVAWRAQHVTAPGFAPHPEESMYMRGIFQCYKQQISQEDIHKWNEYYEPFTYDDVCGNK